MKLTNGDLLDMKNRNLEALSRNDAFKFTKTFFPYTSGEIGPYFVQSGAIMGNGRDFSLAIEDMSKFVSGSLDPEQYIISGGETRDWMFSIPVAAKLGKRHTMIYKNKKLVGANMRDRGVVHIADLNNEGSSPRDHWIPIIEEAGGFIRDIFFYIDRMESGVQVMRDLELNSYALVPLDAHAWDYLQKNDIVSQEVYHSLRERLEDKHQWAIDMLRSKQGLGTLANLFMDDKSLEKARGVLDHYSEIREETIDQLTKKYDVPLERIAA